MTIMSTKIVDIVEMQMGLLNETIHTRTIRGKADGRPCPPLWGWPDLSEEHRRASGDFREVSLATDQSPDDDGARQLDAGGARGLCFGEGAGEHLPERDSQGSGRVALPGRMCGQPFVLRTVDFLHLPGHLGGGIEEPAADAREHDAGRDGIETKGEVAA
jgi:hypothetical protein